MHQGHLSDLAGIVFGAKPADYGGAGVDLDSFKLTDFRRSTSILQFGALTGDSVLKAYAGATAGAKTTAVWFKTRLADADQGSDDADQFGDRSTVASASSGLTLTAATYDNRTLLVEIDQAELPDGEPWVTIELDATASVLPLAAVTVLQDARHIAEDVPTAIT